MTDNVVEVWKESYVPGYYVSNTGNVRNSIGKLMSQQENHNGYMVLHLKVNDVQTTVRVHRMVAIAFIPNPENKPQVNHKDGNKKNNCVDNLEWVTGEENIEHAFRTGLTKVLAGHESPYAKLTAEDVKYIRESYRPGNKLYGARALARKFGVHHSTIEDVIHKNTYKNS